MRTPNPVVLSGDIHAFTAADIHHPDHPDGAPVAAKFVGGSIISTVNDPRWREEARVNPGIRFAEYRKRGYGRVDLRPDRADVAFVGLADATDLQSPAAPIARFSVGSGRAGIAEATA